MKRKPIFSWSCKGLLIGSALGLIFTAAVPSASAEEPSGTLTVAWLAV